MVRTGGSRHTGLAAPPHRNIQSVKKREGWDHPRSRGEYLDSRTDDNPALGSPPPMRGTLIQAIRLDQIPGITPARAGNTLKLMTIY